MTANLECPGLPAYWINGWLAAVGATVLCPQLRLRWTRAGTPRAVLSMRDDAVDEAIAASWPTAAYLEELPIAKQWSGTPEVKMHREVLIDTFVQRVQAARSHPDSWTLSSTMTDLAVTLEGQVVHAPFDAPAPQGLTLHERLLKTHGAIALPPTAERVRQSLQGLVARVRGNGLGFDQSRLASFADTGTKFVDPVVEVLAFFGLRLLPVRGPGREATRQNPPRATPRNWSLPSSGPRTLRFQWPAWTQPLDWHAIDALLDVWNPSCPKSWPRYGVHAAWQTVRYEAKNRRNPTRAYGSERM